jgi:hypothetical protein
MLLDHIPTFQFSPQSPHFDLVLHPKSGNLDSALFARRCFGTDCSLPEAPLPICRLYLKVNERDRVIGVTVRQARINGVNRSTKDTRT